MKATIYDVAKEAGVSIATVSQVINGKGKISQERRDEILKIMKRLHFQPSVIAAALTGKKTYTIGLLIPDISNPFFAEIARSVEDQGNQMGYSLVICNTDNKDERIERYIALLRQKSVDGVIIGTGIENQDILNELLQQSIPIAMIARDIPSLAVNTVVVDDFVGGMMAASHLIELGHTRIAVLAETPKVTSSRERVRGFKQLLTEAGIELSDKWVRSCDYVIEDGARKAMELLREDDRPTALFCCNDLLAIGAMRAAKELNINIPTELSVVGFDNTILASVSDPSLTTVEQPMKEMGKLVVNLLIEELKNQSQVQQRVVLRPKLIVRNSTAKPFKPISG